MPCFKGLAVSIHTPNGPLPEYSIQKQSRQNRISSYIPVPAPKFTPGSDRPEQSSFAISITLLTPGSPVPYSRPDPTPEDPSPLHKIVGGLPGYQSQRGRYSSVIGPYVPLTASPNETVAAYIHFDGRAKEEVATLLRRGVETWVNSRWVGVPESEGGGLAEREFLFREVGLERWLNGLDLKGESKDVAARIERRRQKLEKKRMKKLLSKDSDDEDHKESDKRAGSAEKNGVLRYGADKSTPVEDVSGDEGMASSSDESDDEMPDPEATGQIKVSLYRVMASGEIRKGEYSPSFDAHDDDDEGMQEQKGDDPGVDHTTTFAKPKTLDPKSISTQTVTGIDDPSRPYATFTFFYRGERQLQKMGILPMPEPTDNKKSAAAKRKSRQLDFSTLGPLKSKEGTVGFAGYRDASSKSSIPKMKNGQRSKDEDDMDSDIDEGTALGPKTTSNNQSKAAEDDGDTGEDINHNLTAEELAKRAELADGVKKMQLKRQHSFDQSQSTPKENSPVMAPKEVPPAIETKSPVLSAQTPSIPPLTASRLSEPEPLASPFKKQRASVSAGDGAKLFSSQLSPSSTNFTGGTSPDMSFSGSQERANSLPSTATSTAIAEEEGKATSADVPLNTALKDIGAATNEDEDL